jgi:hypothetical protein
LTIPVTYAINRPDTAFSTYSSLSIFETGRRPGCCPLCGAAGASLKSL